MRRCRPFIEEVLMDVASFCGLLFLVVVQPFAIGLEGAQLNRVADEGRLDNRVDLVLHGHGRARVDLEEPGFHPFVEHDVEAEEFEAAFEVGHHGTERNARQDNYLLNLSPHQVVVVSKVDEEAP